jgi:hypothetical protein
MIPKIKNPVCGEDGKQYGNKWEARCVGITYKCRGTCPCAGIYLKFFSGLAK